MKILVSIVLCAVFLLVNVKEGSGIFDKHGKSEAKNYAISQEFSGFYKNILDKCNEIQDVSRFLCKTGNSSCCALFSAADFCVGKCEDNGINTQANILELFEAITLESCVELVAAYGNCQTPSSECTIIKLFLEICVIKFPLLVSPITSPITSQITSPTTSPTTSPLTSPITSPLTSPITSPLTSPVTSPLTSPVTSPNTSPLTSAVTSPLTSAVTSPLTSPVTSPITSRPAGVFYCDVLGSGRVQMPVSVWCDDTVDCNAHIEDEQAANCNGCIMGQFKCGASETTCQPATNLCNGMQDCENDFDESSRICAP
ncbi:hypothetical protein LOTGIDRAFT_238307 [Lottia gigantea]|uniref:Uncharacterized protein n=1 Tax=Lottia gigantea TaxID=225164 RepID=V4B5A8_LOTGI|nr:hypothetical protein LOTGIDRAFT_238307 [Lottia gigantea]ESP01182.1 hypothetical protein LOTGIDRAFT_238307 [Lottia gigantea]